MKLSPFEAPLFTSSKPYFFEQKGTQLAQPSFPPPSMQVFPRQPMQYLSKDSERYMTANGTVQKVKSMCISLSVFSPKTVESPVQIGSKQDSCRCSENGDIFKTLGLFSGTQTKSPELSYCFQN